MGAYDDLLAPSRQLYEGPVFDYSPERWRANMGQMTPSVRNEIIAQKGRYLSGLGEGDMQQQMDAPEESLHTDPEVYRLEEQDDVYGSGIFDDPRRPGTAQSDDGVFASHYGLPGYAARQRPFAVSTDVSSTPSGAEYVEIPGGGMTYIEAYGRQVWPELLGPVPQPPRLRPPPVGGRFSTYAYLTDDGYVAEGAVPLKRAQADVAVARVPVGQPDPSSYHAPETPRGHAPREPAYRVVPLRRYPAERRLAQRPAPRRVPTRAIGAAPAAPNSESDVGTWLRWGLVGLAIGAVGHMVLEPG